MSDGDGAVSLTHHKPNVGTRLAEMAVLPCRTAAPSVTRSQNGGM